MKPTLMRLIDFLKQQGITAMLTSLTSDNPTLRADSQLGVSSLMDTWVMLANLEDNGERTRSLQVLKSRGMAHSNQVREFVFGPHGVELIDVYRVDSKVLTGSARSARQRGPDGEDMAPRSVALARPRSGVVARGRRVPKVAR